MASQEPIFDSPTGWVQKHIQDYIESDGAKGISGEGSPRCS